MHQCNVTTTLSPSSIIIYLFLFCHCHYCCTSDSEDSEVSALHYILTVAYVETRASCF